MDRSDAIDRALSSLKAIKAQHDTFIAQFDTLTETRAGSIVTVDGELKITCLGVPVICHSRPVFKNEAVSYEYHFFAAPSPDTHVPLVSIYITQDGHLNSPLPESRRICDFNNSYVAERIVDLVASSMLRSAVFSPRA